MQRVGDNLLQAGIERDLARGVAVCASQALRSIVKITLRCNLLKTKGDSVWWVLGTEFAIGCRRPPEANAAGTAKNRLGSRLIVQRWASTCPKSVYKFRTARKR